MKAKTVIFSLVIILLFAVSPSFPVTQYQGNDIYVTGDGGYLDGWNPGGSSTYKLEDEGASGDAVADDGVFSRTISIPQDGSTSGTFYWKAAANGWIWECPASMISSRMSTKYWGSIPQDVTFYFNSNDLNDGWRPDHAAGDKGILNCSLNPFLSASGVYRAVGNWQDEIGDSGDWNFSSSITIMHDDGLNGDDTASDGIYSFQTTGIPPGSYMYKVGIDGSDDPQVNQGGLMQGTAGFDYGFTVLDSTDVITFKLNIDNSAYKAGRITVHNNNPLVNPGPPFYATSSSDDWTTQLNVDSQLYDDATHGDAFAGDNIYSRIFTVATPGEHLFRLKQGIGPYYPDSGDYPFVTTAANQQVRVQFDTNQYTDTDFQPDTRFPFVNIAAVKTQSRIQAVGDWQTEFGGSDWTPDDDNFLLSDDASAPDGNPGDLIYSRIFGPSFFGSTTFALKVVGEGGWTYQFGGTGEGYTKSGNNDNMSFTTDSGGSFTAFADTVTGRAGAGSVPPQRPNTIYTPLTPATGANGAWTFYE